VTPGLLDRRAPCHAARGSPVSGARWCKHKDVPPPDSQEAPIPSHFTAPFDQELGLQFTELTPDGARAQLAVTPRLLQPMGLVHGGVYCSMIESMASVAAFTWLNSPGKGESGKGGNVVGVNNNTDFLRSISSGMVYGAAEPIHRGRRQQLWLVTITDDSDRVVARGQVRLQNLEA
jgi:1,4-dihydroxy-2-naphthoyl-CoA hydrolase